MIGGVAPETRLQELDELLARLRTAVQRPEYRRRILADPPVEGGITTLRLLGAVDHLAAEGAPSIKETAARLALEHSTVSRSVDVATGAGLLVKRSCEDDHRRTRLELTARGRTLLADTHERRRAMLRELTDGWPPGQLDQLVDLLTDLVHGFDALEGDR